MSETEASPDAGFPELLGYLNQSRGVDLSGYKPASLMRRVRRRMEVVNLGTFPDYVDYLEVHPEEVGHLLNTILINVTNFFRDPALWTYLAGEVIPRIVAGKTADEPIRVWSAGCASGQEAYTLSMLFAEAIGPEAFRERVKVYGTDVDHDALSQARHGVYSAREVEEVPAELREKYFEPVGERFTFRKEPRRSIIFGRHDLIQDAPISRLDLLVCRNTLMYFNTEAQSRIIDRFHFATNDGGFVVLGKAEMLLSRSNYFATLDLKNRVFEKLANGSRGRLWPVSRLTPAPVVGPSIQQLRIREAAFDASPVAQIIFDINGVLALVNQQGRTHLGISSNDLGKPLAELDIAQRPIELRSLVAQAITEGRPAVSRDVEWRRANLPEPEFFDIHIVPLSDGNGSLTGVSLAFANVTHQRRLQDELQHSARELASAYEELQSTNEELETTNEELQSTVEELETTNEELHSANEELETMNEELHSANEELQTMNEELRQRSEELNSANAFLQSILASLSGGVAVVDRDLLVLIWNLRAEDLWGIRSDEAHGKHFLNLDIGLPVNELRLPIRACLAGESGPVNLDLDAVNRRGRPIRCRVSCVPLMDPSGQTNGVIIRMDGQDGDRQQPDSRTSP